jgi:hypothetical protein
MGAAELLRGNREAAISWCMKSLATFNEWLFTYITLAAAYVDLNRMDDARAMVQRIRELNPTLTMKNIEENVAKVNAFGDAVIPVEEGGNARNASVIGCDR